MSNDNNFDKLRTIIEGAHQLGSLVEDAGVDSLEKHPDTCPR